MKILKFGGSSLATPENIERVVEIVLAARSAEPVVVVSALGGVTNDLAAATGAAARREDGYAEVLGKLEERHLEAARALVADGEDRTALVAQIQTSCADLHDLLHGVFLLRESTPRSRDTILSYGERLASALVAAALTAAGVAAEAHDARRLILTDETFGRAQVELEASYARIRSLLRETERLPVVTGFIGATAAGQTTTLGRGGSDYTASIVGAALQAEAIELWTDVDGVMSADPRMVSSATALHELSYAELMELSHFGAKVVYPPSIHPARSAGIPLAIKNTFRPEEPGTLVNEEAAPSGAAVRGISSIHRISLMRLEGDGMVGVAGIARRLFGALAHEGISAILISQGSSEHSICFAVAPEDAEMAGKVVSSEFALERRLGIVDELVTEDDLAVVAAVGEGMRERPGIAGRIFNVLGRHGVNVHAIAQGSSELNISLVIRRDQEARALNAIHRAFFAPHRHRASVVVVGVGRVGGELVSQLLRVAPQLLAHENLDLCLAGVVSSRHMAIDREGLGAEAWRQRLEAAPATDFDALIEELAVPGGDARIVVDCTASDTVIEHYPRLIARGIGVVAANKRWFAGPYERFRELRDRASRSRVPLLYEATVGAGLPVLGTLANLRRTGDRIERIEGVLSGTLNAVLDRVMSGERFSRAVEWAHAEGLTEPHPFDDLSGEDVARKLCILARGSSRRLELDEVGVEPLLPGERWRDLPLEEFWSALPQLDSAFEERRKTAHAEGQKLRYVGSLDELGARVRLEAVAPEHPAATVSGPDNLIAFTTARYDATPLVVRGPGAGPEVTASGVFADVLSAAVQLAGVNP